METLDDVLQQVELKYCERCGGLWFRLKDSMEIYCPGCAPAMEELPKRQSKRVLVVAVNSVEEVEACLAELTGWCEEGGHA